MTLRVPWFAAQTMVFKASRAGRDTVLMLARPELKTGVARSDAGVVARDGGAYVRQT